MWTVVPQHTKEGEVFVKMISYFPLVDDDGERRGWGRLRDPIKQVCLNLDNKQPDDAPIKVRYCNGSYSVMWPDSVRPKTIKVRGREVLDRLNPGERVVKGEVERFPSLQTLYTYLHRRFNPEVAEQVKSLIKES